MDKFAALEALTAVVETGSFQAASERLKLAKSVISRRVSQLEKQLGCRLLYRTTRKLSLTNEGQQFYQRSLQILTDLNDAEQEIAQDSGNIQGQIKLAAPLSFGMNHLSAIISGFMKLHDDIEINLDLNDRQINLVEDGFDMAIRIGELEDSTLIARQLGNIDKVTCASPEYLKQHGTPESANQLLHHQALQYSNISYKQQWTFIDNKGIHHFAQPVIRMYANNGEALAKAAIEGLGIVSGPYFLYQEYIASGQLTAILNQYHYPSIGIYAVYPPGRLMPQRIKAFTEYLLRKLEESDYRKQLKIV